MTIQIKTEAEILALVIDILIRLFELEAAQVTPAANLYEDLDIDSIDAIDLIVELKKLSGKKVQPEDFKSVRTVQDVVNAIKVLIDEG